MVDPSWWWSLPALVLGGVTAAIVVLYSLMEPDLKCVLAYSTIEVGIIFIAVGLAHVLSRALYFAAPVR
jgi:hydrogenase-4 component B